MFPKIPNNGVNERNGHGVVYEFSTYRLIASEHLLLRNEEKLHLTPKAFELLVFLIERNNRVVSKAEIIEGVWSESFVEEANLAVHVSSLRKVFSGNEDQVSIETLPRLGYRLKIEGGVRKETSQPTGFPPEDQNDGLVSDPRAEAASANIFSRAKLICSIGVIAGLLGAGMILYALYGFPVRADQTADFDYIKTKNFQTFKTPSCSRETSTSNLENGGCEEAVAEFSLASNPNGNWSYGYTTRDDVSTFILFTNATHNKHFASPEVPADMWSRFGEWHPLIIRNKSPLTILIQEGVILPPNMFEMHPGPDGERSVLRWTAPVTGHFRAQGQFRGLNISGKATTDALIVHNSKETRFSENIDGFNVEKPFDLTFKISRGDTIDFSVGYGTNKNYECDSTGFSVMITTIAVTDR